MKKIFPVVAGLVLLSCNQSRQATPVAASSTAAQDTLRKDSVVENDELQAPDRFKALIDSGVGFLASGNEPFWSLEMVDDSVMIFKTPDGAPLATPLPSPARAADANVLRYAAESKQGSLIVEIRKAPCENDMSGEKLNYQVNVEAKYAGGREVLYKGCGRYLNDGRLSNKWTLEGVNGRALKKEDFTSNFPRIEINLAEEKVVGNGGCNQFSSTARASGKFIKFGAIRSTKMACPSLSFEAGFFAALSSRSMLYSFSAGRLRLQLSSDSTFIFKKED